MKSFSRMAGLIVLLATAGCAEPRKTTGYEIRVSDGWSYTYEYCDSYKKEDGHLQCFDKNNDMQVEIFMPEDTRFYIRRLN